MTTFGVDFYRHLQDSNTEEENIPHIISSCIDEIDTRGIKLCLRLRVYFCGRRGNLMVGAPDSGTRGPGSSRAKGHCVVFLDKTLYSDSASLHPGV